MLLLLNLFFVIKYARILFHKNISFISIIILIKIIIQI